MIRNLSPRHTKLGETLIVKTPLYNCTYRMTRSGGTDTALDRSQIRITHRARTHVTVFVGVQPACHEQLFCLYIYIYVYVYVYVWLLVAVTHNRLLTGDLRNTWKNPRRIILYCAVGNYRGMILDYILYIYICCLHPR